MGKLSTLVSQGNSSLSPAAKGANKGLLSSIGGGCAFLGTFALLYISVVTLNRLCKTVYKFDKFLNPSIILDLAKAAKETRYQQLWQDSREEEELDLDAQHGIQTIPKKAKIITVYQLIGIVGSAAALFLAIISSFHLFKISSSGFKNQIKAPFFNEYYMLASPLIVFFSNLCQGVMIAMMQLRELGTGQETGPNKTIQKMREWTKDYIAKWDKWSAKHGIKQGAIVSCTKRDEMDFSFKTLTGLIGCSAFLLYTSALHTMSTGVFSSSWYISCVPIFIACANLCVTLYKFILDCRYVYNCVEDNKTRLILMGIVTPITEGTDQAYKKLSRIRVTGKTSELINEFQNKESQCLALQERLDPDTQQKQIQNFQMHAMIMRHAIKTISKNTGCESFTIDMDIKYKPKSKPDKRTTNPVLYATTLNGSNTYVMKEGGFKKYEFTGSDVKIQNQYVDLVEHKETTAKHLLEALHTEDAACFSFSTKLDSAMSLINLIAVGILVKKTPDIAQMDDPKDRKIGGKVFIERIEEAAPKFNSLFSSFSVAVAK